MLFDQVVDFSLGGVGNHSRCGKEEAFEGTEHKQELSVVGSHRCLSYTLKTARPGEINNARH